MTETKKVENNNKEIKVKPKREAFIWGTGRRKTSIARVKLSDGTGKLMVNGVQALDYFKAAGETAKLVMDRAFTAIGRRNKFDATIKVVGGGIKSQLEAVSHGLSRALDKYDHEAFHKILKKNELLTRDSRMKESRKYGLMGARKKKASPKR